VRALAETNRKAAARAIEVGGVEEAAVVLERLLSVAGAGYERSAHLQRALNSRIVIEQAKGMLAERFDLEVEEAFALLRGAARSKGMRLRELAESVVASRETPPAVADELAKRWTPSGNAESA
jgi:AmiR/NasT family two-component response regulator